MTSCIPQTYSHNADWLTWIGSGIRWLSSAMMAEKSFLTLKEVAERLRISHSSVLSLVTKGCLKAVDVSTNPRGRSRYMVPKEALEEFEQSRVVSPPPSKPKRRKRFNGSEVISFIK